MVVPAIERHPRVSRVALEVFLWLDVRQRVRRYDLFLCERHGPEAAAMSLGAAPVVGGEAPIEHFPHRVLLALAATAPVRRRVVILGGALFPQGQEGQVDLEVGLSCRGDQDAGSRVVDPLERVPGEPVLRVLMAQRDGQLLGPFGIAGPGAEYVSDARNLLLAPRGTERLLRLRQRQVIDQAQSISRSQGLHFMLAVGVEDGKLDLVATGGPGKIDALLLALVAYDELASSVYRRQDDHERGHHALQLLAVTMEQKERTLLVQQQVVQVGDELPALQAELGVDSRDRGAEKLLPGGIRQRKAPGQHPPHAADACVDDRRLALAVR